ncbi:MAG: R2-like ligand-binding oxidase [Ktedonobacteraceae bacterium]|nr:R2-like ligand-binding oxidase [Ktedonobacteraceae bacterium]
MTLPTDYHTLSSTSPRGLRQYLPPMRLWQKAKRLGVWNPVDIDLTQDKLDWQGLKAEEQEYLLSICSRFLAGEESVTLDLLPLLKVVAQEGRIEEEMFLTSFLWEEAKHVEGFRRFFDEVADEHSDLTRFYSPPFKQIFYDELPRAMNQLYTDTSVEAQVNASVTYNMIIEGVMAETGYYVFSLALTRNNLMPGMQQFVANLKRDESRHIAFAVYFLSRLVAEHGDRAWNTIEQRMQYLLPLVQESSQRYGVSYTIVPFNIDPEETSAYSSTQYQKRLERIKKARGQTLDEINNELESLESIQDSDTPMDGAVDSNYHATID